MNVSECGWRGRKRKCHLTKKECKFHGRTKLEKCEILKKHEQTVRPKVNAIEPKFVTVGRYDIDEFEAREIINKLCKMAHHIAYKKGFWDTERSDAECMALIMTEIGEALQELRKPDYSISKVEEELADAVIRIFDYCGARCPMFGTTLILKMKENMNRPYKHGKRF